MKNQTIIAIVAVLIIILGIQSYMMFRMNDRLNQLTDRATPLESTQIKIPNIAKPTTPTPNFDDDFFKGRAWNPYEEMQRTSRPGPATPSRWRGASRASCAPPPPHPDLPWIPSSC